jgi:hypothetical protein
MAESGQTATINVTPAARESLKRIERWLFPHMRRPTYSDAIHEIERRITTGELGKRPVLEFNTIDFTDDDRTPVDAA